MHPVSPVITDDGLFCFVVDSPKRRDLERDGRYALHSFPPEDSDDEAYVAGRAVPVTDPARVAAIAGNLRAAPQVDWRLFELERRGGDARPARQRAAPTPLSAHPGRPARRGAGRGSTRSSGAATARRGAAWPPTERRGAGPVSGAGAGALDLWCADTRSRR